VLKRVAQSETLYRIRQNPTTLLGLGIVTLMVVLAIFAPWIAPYDPLEKHFEHVSEPPSRQFWMGTDQFGQDIFSRAVWAARLDLFIATTAVVLSLVLGSLLGALSGYLGGWFDEVFMRLMDILQAFPSLILAMGIAFALGPGVLTVIVATSAVNIPGYARLMRSTLLSEKQRTYVLAARAVGNPPWRILFRHLVPNATTPVLVNATLHFGWAILEAAGLSFLGLGVAIPNAEWGVMINMGLQDFWQGHWWAYTFPGVFIALTVLGFNLVGDGLSDLLDPRRARQ
jgi:peptide/nickel transport system permease protein